MGASNSWSPQGLSRPVMGLLYLYHITTTDSPDDEHSGARNMYRIGINI